MFLPKLVTTLRTYDRRQFAADATAGVIVGVVAIPLAIAFAIASGVTPAAGLWTAIVAGFIISALGGSRVQIGGPTGAFVVIVFGIVQQYGVEGLTLATMLAGLILIVLGATQLGGMIRYIPFPVVTGFTSAIGVTIAVQQLDAAFGLPAAKYPPHVVERIAAYVGVAGSVNVAAVALCAATLAILIFWPRVSTKIPAPFVALLATTLFARAAGLHVVTIGDRFGVLQSALPHPVLPDVTFAQLRGLIVPAFTIAGLGAIESLLSAVVADGMIGSRHRPNMELVAQGVANVVSPLFGGIPATGAIARTATNVKAGGRTPVAGIIHAVTLLVVTLFFGTWAALIPLATLAGILLMVAWRMMEIPVFIAELRSSRSDAAVLVTVFALTLLVDLTAGIGVGMVMASFLFMRRMAEVADVRSVTDLAEADDVGEESDRMIATEVPKGIQIYEVNGPFFFGAAEKFRDALAEISQTPDVLIIRLRHVPAIDSTGVKVLRDLVERSRNHAIDVLFAELRPQPLALLKKSGLLDELGAENVVGSIDLAVALAMERQRTRGARLRRSGPFGRMSIEREVVADDHEGGQ